MIDCGGSGILGPMMRLDPLSKVGVWLGSWLLVGCAEVPGFEEFDDAALEFEESTPIAPERVRLHRTSDGRTAAVLERDHMGLFEYEGDDPLPALMAWSRVNAELLGLERIEPEEDYFSEFVLEREIETDVGLRIHRYAQRYRGHRVFGSDTTVALTSNDAGEVISIVGAFVDGRIDLEGLRDGLDRESAERIVLAEHPEARVHLAELVAVFERGTMAWHFELIEPDGRVDVLVGTVDGEFLIDRPQGANSTFDHVGLAGVTGYSMTNDPQSTTVVNFTGMPGSTWDGSWTQSTGWMLRMGNDRAAAYDLEFDNSTLPTVYLTPQILVGSSWAKFIATPGGDFDQFTTQDHFVKMSKALTVLDARTSSFGWDHHASTSFDASDPAPLSLMANADRTPEAGEPNNCGSAQGRFTNSSWPSGVQAPYTGVTTSFVWMCHNDPSKSGTGTLLHEIGHYVDNHATFDLMGIGVVSPDCELNTTDEAIPLSETVAELTGLYLLRKLYPSLPYTLSTTSTPCTFTSTEMGGHKIHDPSCITSASQIGWFPNHHAMMANENAPCGHGWGDDFFAIEQAVWAWLHRRSCSRTSPYTCVTNPGGDNDEFMRGMIYAMSLSNAMSYETFFEAIQTWLWFAEGADEAELFQETMATYGILDP
jgi:hypothetical protein